MLTAESCDVSKPTLQFLEKRCTFAVSMCVILPTWLRDVATMKRRIGCDVRKINIPFFDADGKGFKLPQKPMRLHFLSDG